MKILLTGSTGFLGSHIADKLIQRGCQVLALKRSGSSLLNCKDISSKVVWCDCDNDDWLSKAILWSPDVIIHSAWAGVDAANRDNWDVQLSNIDFTCDLLQVAMKSSVKKFIALGSQAEYGEFANCINEEYPLNPVQKYAIAKVFVFQMVKALCQLNDIDWYWVRIFATFGERESNRWLIPSLISKMRSGEISIDLTKCEQKYAYLYVGDLAKALVSILDTKGKCGAYNLSAKKALSLRYVITYIRDRIKPDFQLNFGRLPYRKGQAMCIHAETDKFVQAFGEYEMETFESAIDKMIYTNTDSSLQ